MVVRTYFDRNNTLVYNSEFNTGLNPVCELFYGGNINKEFFSRFIFQFNTDRLKSLYDDKTFADISKLKHTLRLTNTGAFDKDLMGKKTCDGKDRSYSFDLELHPISNEWDEGNGYDYQTTNVSDGKSQKIIGPSNWTFSKYNFGWSGPNSPTYIGSTATGTTITSQHFEHGNENIEMDITDLVNGYITGDTNNGLVLSYPYDLETTPIKESRYVGFFTRHTQTFYEPHVETIYDNPIKDDRTQFYMDKTNKLYLYVYLGGKLTNLDNLPLVEIIGDNGDVIIDSSSTTVTQVSKGVYCTEITIDSSNATNCLQYTDVWSNIEIDGKPRPDVELEFIANDSLEYFNIGDSDEISKRVNVNVTGILNQEDIVRGDIRKVYVSTVIPYTINQKQVVDSLKYRLYTKEGTNEFTVIDYQDINKANVNNYFLIDTISLVPGRYYIDIKTEINQEVNTFKNTINFNIVSQSELRISQ